MDSERPLVKLTHSICIAAIAAAAASSALAEDSVFVDGNMVRKVQQTLTSRGFATAVDGQMGPQTRAALTRFQRAEKLEPTGQLNRQTLVALGLQKPDNAATVDESYSRDTVRTVQRTLNSRGFRAGPADGSLNPRTEQALKEFQKSENLEDSGRLNRRTLAALGVRENEPASSGASAPAQPAASATIREMQRQLNARGYNVGNPDGILGERTRAALREFQRSAKLPVSGEPDTRTLDALGITPPLAFRGG
jgi:peptidoglycan hydrolase-like protein with peptidoglycan-binding domain